MKKQTFIKPGDKFNRLTAIEYDHTGKHNRRYFKFRCDCGNETMVTAEAVISGNTKSCGCLSRESKAATALPGCLGAMRQVILQNYKRQGKHDWTLTEDEYYKISQMNCHYCGDPPSQIKRGKGSGLDFVYNGLDRIDSRKPYILNNVVPCCKKCNVAKNNMTINEFKEWVTKIYSMADQWSNL
jgi:5-methylcytosine-specific restriction endonuclease McrA